MHMAPSSIVLAGILTRDMFFEQDASYLNKIRLIAPTLRLPLDVPRILPPPNAIIIPL